MVLVTGASRRWKTAWSRGHWDWLRPVRPRRVAVVLCPWGESWLVVEVALRRYLQDAQPDQMEREAVDWHVLCGRAARGGIVRRRTMR